MTYREELRQRLADVFGCDEQDLLGEDIYECLYEAESAGATVYWGCVEPRIAAGEVF